MQELLVRAISLLMLEAKLVIVGGECGMVSCAVLGLLVLMKPLEWVNPVIPMLPMKLTDFLESPVPILVGLPLDDQNKEMDATYFIDQFRLLDMYFIVLYGMVLFGIVWYCIVL